MSSSHRYLKLDDGTVWPDDVDGSIQWKLRYAPDTLTRGDQLVAASVLACWALLSDPTEPLEPKISRVREIRRRLKARARYR